MTKDKQIQMIRQIAKVVSDYYGLTIFELVAKTRKREIVSKRQIAQELSYSLIPQASLTTIAFELGRKGHATVLHSIEVVNNLCDIDTEYREHYEKLHRILSINLFPTRQKKYVLDRLVKSKNLKSARLAAKRHKISYNLTYI